MTLTSVASRRVRRSGVAAALLGLSLAFSGCSVLGSADSDPSTPAPSVSTTPTPSTSPKGRVSRPQASGAAHVPGFVPSQMLVPAMDTYEKESAGGQVYTATWSSARTGQVKQLVRSLSYANRHLRLDHADLGGGAVRLTGQGQAADIAAATDEEPFTSSDSLVIYTIDVVPAPSAKLTMVRVIATVIDAVEPVVADMTQP